MCLRMRVWHAHMHADLPMTCACKIACCSLQSAHHVEATGCCGCLTGHITKPSIAIPLLEPELGGVAVAVCLNNLPAVFVSRQAQVLFTVALDSVVLLKLS